MRTTSANNPVAVSYARSLLELANERGQGQEIGQEMAGLRQLLEENPSFGAYLSDPGVSSAERTGALERLFRGRASPLVMNFLGVVQNHGRLRMLAAIAEAYEDLLDKQLGNVEVDVTVAQRLGPDELEQVRQRVGQALGRNAVVHQYVDESIIGGLVIRVGDRLIDASVRYQLEAIRDQMLAGRARATRAAASARHEGGDGGPAGAARAFPA